MKIRFSVITLALFAITVLMPQRAGAQVAIKDSFAIQQIKANTKNSKKQKENVEDIQKTIDKTSKLIGQGSMATFTAARKSMKENLEEKMLPMSESPLSGGSYSKWNLSADDYKYDNRDSKKVENALVSFINKEGVAGTNVTSDMKNLKEHKLAGKNFMLDTAKNGYATAIASKGETENRAKPLEDIESVISNAESVRDDVVGNTLLQLTSAFYFQQMLNLYANDVEVAVSRMVDEGSSSAR
ncbi:MAG: hypothetical protein AB7U85_07030 [Alphaproteobacteria bacterium]